MPTLGVCGDSFMAATLNFDHRSDCKDSEGKHFTEILAKKLGYEYFTLARGGCSNTAIRLQISEMVKQKVDLVIIGLTSPNRLEFPNPDRNYDHNIGVYNLDYRTKYYPDLSTKNLKFQHNLVTETLTNIFKDDRPLFKKLYNSDCEASHPNINKEQLTALEYYIDYILDYNYKNILDGWAIHSGIKFMDDNDINYILIKAGLSWEGNEFDDCHGTKFIDPTSNLNPRNYPLEGPRRFHTTDESQEKLADLWYEYIVNNNFIRS